MGVTKLYQQRQTNHRTHQSDSATTTDEDALETLRNRYARGEIDEAEFERRLEALLETESIDEAAAYAAREKVEE